MSMLVLHTKKGYFKSFNCCSRDFVLHNTHTHTHTNIDSCKSLEGTHDYIVLKLHRKSLVLCSYSVRRLLCSSQLESLFMGRQNDKGRDEKWSAVWCCKEIPQRKDVYILWARRDVRGTQTRRRHTSL